MNLDKNKKIIIILIFLVLSIFSIWFYYVSKDSKILLDNKIKCNKYLSSIQDRYRESLAQTDIYVFFSKKYNSCLSGIFFHDVRFSELDRWEVRDILTNRQLFVGARKESFLKKINEI